MGVKLGGEFQFYSTSTAASWLFSIVVFVRIISGCVSLTFYESGKIGNKLFLKTGVMVS